MTNVWVKEEIKLEFENIYLNQEDKSLKMKLFKFKFKLFKSVV